MNTTATAVKRLVVKKRTRRRSGGRTKPKRERERESRDSNKGGEGGADSNSRLENRKQRGTCKQKKRQRANIITD